MIDATKPDKRPVLVRLSSGKKQRFPSEEAARKWEKSTGNTVNILEFKPVAQPPGSCPRLTAAEVAELPNSPNAMIEANTKRFTTTSRFSANLLQGNHESAVVGCLLSYENTPALDACLDAGLKPEDFTEATGRLYGAIMDLHKKGVPVDLISVQSHLSPETLAAVGGMTELSRIVDTAPVVHHAAYHVGKIVDASSKRRLAVMVGDFAARVKGDIAPAELITTFRAAIDAEDMHSNRNADLNGDSLGALADSGIDPESILLGVEGIRYLCKGGTMIFVGPSGVGKSTASAQQDILWSLGSPAFGIAPARPLKIVTIQAENDRGDLIHMARGIMAALHLSPEDRARVDTGTVYVSHNASTGADFLAFIDRVIRRHRPDLIRIDPLMAYAGGDLTKPETIANFCRNGLNRIATRHGIGIVVCHHTPKQNGTNANVQARKQWGAFDWQYAAAGGADLANWARAMMVIESLSRDVFAFRAAKRWPGWKNAEGEAEHVRYFIREKEHGKVFWHDATPEDVATAGSQTPTGRDNGPDLDVLAASAISLVKTPMSPKVFKEMLMSPKGLKLGKGKAEALIAKVTEDGGPLVRWKGNQFPCSHYIGTPAQRKQWESPAL